MQITTTIATPLQDGATVNPGQVLTFDAKGDAKITFAAWYVFDATGKKRLQGPVYGMTFTVPANPGDRIIQARPNGGSSIISHKVKIVAVGAPSTPTTPTVPNVPSETYAGIPTENRSICVNPVRDNLTLLAPALKADGVTWLRFWYHPKFAAQAKALGFKTICVWTLGENPATVPAESDLTAAFGKVVKDPNVDAWEIGNEPDLETYYPNGDEADFVKRFFSPLAKLAKAAGKFVIAAAPGVPANYLTVIQNMTAAGALNYADAVNLHMYHSDPAFIVAAFENTRKLSGKPVYWTEANPVYTHEASNAAKSIANMKAIASRVAKLCPRVCIYAATAHGSWKGVYAPDGKPSDLYPMARYLWTGK